MLKNAPNEGIHEETPLIRTRAMDNLADEDRELVEEVLKDVGVSSNDVRHVITSDILPSGLYGKNFIVEGPDRILHISEGKLAQTVRYDDISEIISRDFVGNGVLEARSKNGARIEIARFSRTISDLISELALSVNRTLGHSDQKLTEIQDQVSKVSGPSQAEGTYRCPTCGYPLAHQGDVCPKCARSRSFIFKVWKYLKPSMPMVIVGLFLSIIVTLCNLGPGLLVRLIVDEAIMAEGLTEATRYRTLMWIIITFFLFIIVRMVTQHYRIKIMGSLGTRVVRSLRIDTYRALQRLSLAYYDSTMTGRIMSRVLGDTQMVQGFVVNALQTAFINILMIIGISITLFTANPFLATIALGPVPIVIVLARYFSKRFKGIFRSVRRKYSSLSATVAESVTGVRVVKSFAQEDQEFDTFEGKNRDLFDASISAVRTRAVFRPAVLFAMTLGTIVVWLVGGRQVIQEALTLGLLLQFITYMNQFYAPIQQLLQLTETYQQSATSAERVFNIMNMPSETSDHDKAVDLENPRGRIVLDDVSFSYQEGERVLKDVNLTIEPGQMIGVVGQTGSGKSTLVSLVCRFYDPTEGTITIDRNDLKNIRTQSLRSNIGMVLQDTFLFARTIKENIAYGMPMVKEAQIIEAAKAANAHDFIMKLPDGYDSSVGERGINLSGGEKQRISIARAILKDPAILILDEATSAVDSATEASIQEAMDRLVKGRTTIAIAHRLSTLRNADKLIVIEEGVIAEEGSHEELLARDGIYAQLCRTQANFAKELQ